MKRLVLPFAAAALFALMASSSAFASTLLCQTGPVTLTGNNNNIQSIYTCAIPANSVPTGKSIRLTVTLSSPGQIITGIVLNGTTLTDIQTPVGGQTWDFVLMHTGSTTGSIAGIRPGSSQNTLAPVGYQSVSPATLPWASGWTLEVFVQAATGVIEEGCSFTVEILD
jgi:hypothetical protein